ncbi:CDF family Co(II)/Ni(II) efflux transporter DmeF [Ramlibacter humi]|uniref:Cation transporter n=1 Tax=Ramlibacter humi TaxID=2530451 RepID=A0A4Z0CEB8_9BURK|nr:CDF family Co(II)/Ni(II) efflux transporter DmeF [Ramlibacter humi]TFZ08649.1 cation transporter [Ramlibacter humi]
MHAHDLSRWTHAHEFHAGNTAAERGTRLVMWITLATMVVEIAAGWWFNSMALLADGWHMSSHALAIGLAAFAYRAARRYSVDQRFAFGTWKIEVLSGYTSAILLVGVALLMIAGSVERLVSPQPIAYAEAVVVAVVGLAVNMVCALVLARAGDHGHHHHGHDHHGHHDHGHHHRSHAADRHGHEPRHGQADLNLRSAYVHVLADAATSVLAIAALVGAWMFGWTWLDPLMGIAGAVLVAVWAKGLMQQTGAVLLDREMDHPVVDEIREVVEAGPGEPRIADLHVWRVGRGAYACAISVVTHSDQETPDTIRARLAEHEEVVHATIEINRCCARPGR